jgi:hypothetical protein
MSFSAARLIAFAVALAAIVRALLFLTRTYIGTAIRAISQDRADHAADGRRPGRIYLITSALGGGLAGLAACLLVLQYDIHPAIGLSFGPITFLICVLGGLGNLIGGFVAAFIFASSSRSAASVPARVGLRARLRVLHRDDVLEARRACSRSGEGDADEGRRPGSAGSRAGRHRRSRAGQLSAAPDDHGAAVGLHLHQLVDHGPARHGQLRARRVPGHRRLHVVLLWNHRALALARRPVAVALAVGWRC